MPKELTHFLMAEKSAALLSGTRLGAASLAQPDALLYGSIFPDILYYSARKLPDGISALPNRMHGKRGGLDFIRMQAGLLRQQPDNPTRAALLLGMLCHVSLDETLHPLVGYLTEGSSDQTPKLRSLATQRHRALESLLDMTLCPERIGATRYILKTIGGAKGEAFLKDLPMLELAQEANTTPGKMAEAYRSSWKSYGLLQRLCGSPNFSRQAYFLGRLLPDAIRELIVLLYPPQLESQASIFKGTLEYRHPESGQPFSLTLNDLLNQAVARAVQVAGQMEAHLRGGSFPESLPNPCSGVCGDLRYFARPPVPRLFGKEAL